MSNSPGQEENVVKLTGMRPMEAAETDDCYFCGRNTSKVGRVWVQLTRQQCSVQVPVCKGCYGQTKTGREEQTVKALPGGRSWRK